jgi:ectoine hydroxylase-related dioxygenase (phytanoyl-CoA dioxygenase family)
MIAAVMGAGAEAAIVTPEQRERWERDGYMIVEDTGIAPAVLDGVMADTNSLYMKEPGEERWGEANTPEHGVFFTWHRIMDAWHLSANVKQVALNPRILAILEELFGRKPLPFQTLNFPFGTQQAAHSDTIHFDSIPQDFMVGVWVALEDMDMDNGPVCYYPGSHKLPRVTMQTIGVEADSSNYSPHYEDAIRDLVKREGLEPEYALIKKGQALIWAANLLHGGAEQRDMSRSRYSQVTHVYFEGCRYYTPLMSSDPGSEDGTFWRDPQWIA